MTHPAHYHTHKHPHSPPSRGSLIRWLRRLKQHRGVGQLVRIALLLVFGLGTLGGLALLVLFVVAVRDLPDPNSLTNRTIEQSTRIYDKTGTHILYEIFGEENRTLVPLQEGFCKDDPEFPTDPKGVPLFALQATLAAEDRRFCRHFGFDPKGLARAALANLRGSRVGGSTLTQQLVKNAILSNEKTLTRKIKELLLSIELERRYSKDAILQIYFNEIPYGSTYYGIQSASLNLFNKPVSALTLAEAATLAAIPQAPTRYLNNPDRLKVRRDWILDSMATLGYQKQEAVDAAKATDTPITIRVQNIEAPHFVFYVKEQLEEIYGRQLVEEGGLKVITTLDYDKQMIAQKAVSDEVEKNGKSLGFSNAALVALDPKTGHILSMVGSKDFFDKEIGGQVNVTTRLRQPGSSFKPIVYAKAFELGYTPSTILWDVKTVFDTAVGPYIPNNYSGKEYGPISLRNALQGSLNISAVKAMYLVGVESALQFAESLGYSSFKDRSRLGLAVVLGGGEVQLLEHVNAYAAFANGGIHHKTTPILRVEDANGEVLQEWKPEEGQRVMSEQTASWMSQVLSDNNARAYIFGLNSPLALKDRPVAGKTGTTTDYRDSWMVGYTPSLVAGVWGGNNDNKAMGRGVGGVTVSAPIWNSFMSQSLKNTAVEAFPVLPITETGKPVLDGKTGEVTLDIDEVSGKLATEFTPPQHRVQKIFSTYNTILHDVFPQNPLGPAPTESERDPAYQVWQQAIVDWLQRRATEQGIPFVFEAPPTEFDDVHLPHLQPEIELNSPTPNQRITSNTLLIEAQASAPRGIARVEVYIDTEFLGSEPASSDVRFSVSVPEDLPNGSHTLKVIAYDDVNNSRTVSIPLLFDRSDLGNRTTFLEITDPKKQQTIERVSETYTVVANTDQPRDFSQISLLVRPVNGNFERVAAVVQPSSPFLTFEWSLPTSGTWVLMTEGETVSGQRIRSNQVVVHVKTTVKAPQPPTTPLVTP